MKKAAKAVGNASDSNPDSRHKWNQENIKQITDALIAARYYCGSVYKVAGLPRVKGADGSIEMWIGPGAVTVIALQRYNDNMGFELWKPLTKSQSMEDVIKDLESAIRIVPLDNQAQ